MDEEEKIVFKENSKIRQTDRLINDDRCRGLKSFLGKATNRSKTI